MGLRCTMDIFFLNLCKTVSDIKAASNVKILVASVGWFDKKNVTVYKERLL